MQESPADKALRPQYNKPPIVEAICAIEFAQKPSAPKLDFKSHFKALLPSYDGQVRALRTMQTQFKFDGESVENSPLEFSPPHLWHFYNASGSRLAAISEKSIAIHATPPYAPGWSDVRTRIDELLDLFDAECSPIGVTRIGIRYINKFSLPLSGGLLYLGDYFTQSTDREGNDSGPALTLLEFLHRYHLLYDDQVTHLATTLQSVPPEAEGEDVARVILDIDVFRAWKTPLAVANALEELDSLKLRHSEQFEASITPKTRELFNA